MKVLVTGATGYLGSHLVRYLIKNNFEVVILKRKTSSMKRLLGIKDFLKCYDINSLDFTTVFKEQINFDAIIHTSTCYGRKGESKKKIFEANTLFPTKLLETAILFKIKTFINTDTYYNVDRNISVNLKNYILSKKKFLDNAKVHSLKKKIKFINLRLEHVYGPKDSETKFVNWLVSSLSKRNKKINLTKCEQKRDMIFIDDVVKAFVIVLKNISRFNRYYLNIGVGSGKTVALKEFVKLAFKLKKSSCKLIFGSIPYQKNEIMISKADNKILKKLGWKCTTNLKKGLISVLNKSN